MLSAQKKKEKDINLLPQEEFAASPLGRTLRWLLTTFRYLVITTEMVVISAFISRFWFDSRNADLNDKIKQQREYIEAYAAFEQSFRDVQDKIAIFSDAVKNAGKGSDITSAIVKNLPKDVRLIKVDLNSEGTLLISGSSLSEKSIEQLVVNLSDDKIMSNVELAQVEAKANTPFISFTIHAGIKDTGGN